MVSPTTDTAPRLLPHWEDLEAFLHIAEEVGRGRTIQEIGESRGHGFGNPRLLYLRLARLEDALCVKLIERRRWSRHPRVTEAGEWLLEHLRGLHVNRRQFVEHFTATQHPALRLACTSPLTSSLLPLIVREAQREPGLHGLRITLLERDDWAQVVEDVRTAHADLGLATAPPRATAPRTTRRETLFTTDRVLLCHCTHPFAARGIDPAHEGVHMEELADDTVALFAPDTSAFPFPSKLGQWMTVPRLEQARAYARIGLAVAPSYRFVEQLLGPDEYLSVQPLYPNRTIEVMLISPRNQRELSATSRHVVHVVQHVGHVLADSLRESRCVHLGTVLGTDTPAEWSTVVPKRGTTLRSGQGAFEPTRDLTRLDWQHFRRALQRLKAQRRWADFAPFASCLVRIDPRRGKVASSLTPSDLEEMGSVLEYWRTRKNWHDYSWYAIDVRVLGRLLGDTRPRIGLDERHGLQTLLEEYRARGRWFDMARLTSRLVRLDVPLLRDVQENEWRALAELLETYRHGDQWYYFAWLAMSLAILSTHEPQRYPRLTPMDWASCRETLDTLRRGASDIRRWYMVASHAHSLAVLMGKAWELQASSKGLGDRAPLPGHRESAYANPKRPG